MSYMYFQRIKIHFKNIGTLHGWGRHWLDSDGKVRLRDSLESPVFGWTSLVLPGFFVEILFLKWFCACILDRFSTVFCHRVYPRRRSYVSHAEAETPSGGPCAVSGTKLVFCERKSFKNHNAAKQNWYYYNLKFFTFSSFIVKPKLWCFLCMVIGLFLYFELF